MNNDDNKENFNDTVNDSMNKEEPIEIIKPELIKDQEEMKQDSQESNSFLKFVDHSAIAAAKKNEEDEQKCKSNLEKDNDELEEVVRPMIEVLSENKPEIPILSIPISDPKNEFPQKARVKTLLNYKTSETFTNYFFIFNLLSYSKENFVSAFLENQVF